MEDKQVKKLEAFLNTLEMSEEKKGAIKGLFLNQLEHLVKEEITTEMIIHADKVNVPIMKGMNVMTDLTNSLKENFSEFFEEKK